MAYEHITLTEEGGVAWLILNRPERLNALSATMVSELRTFFQQLTPKSSARVVVLQGAGRAFCAGRDATLRRTMTGIP